jgi:Flp pilus assembly protein CpaB
VGDPRLLPPRRTLATRPRRRLSTALRRQPIVFWAFAGLAAAAAFVTVEGALAARTEGAEAYGDLVEVVVARVDLEPGAVIADDDVEIRPIPSSMVPADAVGTDPVGRAVRHPIAAGEAVASRRLAPDGAVGAAALLGPGERAVAIPLPAHRSPLEVGQRVDVLATVDPGTAGGRAPTSVVAEGAVVLAVDEHGVTVAASGEDTARIATAVSYSVVSVAIVG